MTTQRCDMTDSEKTEVDKSMLRAAFAALGDLPSNTVEQDQDDIARRVVRSLVAAASVKSSVEASFKSRTGSTPCLEAEAHDAVATAFWLWTEQPGLDIDDCDSSSIAGSRLLGLAQGLAAARAMTMALDLLDEYGSEFAFSSRGASYLAANPELNSLA